MSNTISSTGTLTPSSGFPASGQTIFDGTRYWSFYLSSAQAGKICYRNSTDFASWSAESTVAATNITTTPKLFTVVFLQSQMTLLACYYNTSNNHLSYLRGVMSGTTITWGSITDINAGGSSPVSIAGTLNSSSVPVLAFSNGGSTVGFYVATNALTSTFADTAWTSHGTGAYNTYCNVCVPIPLASGNIMLVIDDNSGSNVINSYTIYTSSFSACANLQSGTGVTHYNWAVSAKSTLDVAYLGVATASTFLFKTYNGSAWSTATAPAWPASGLAATQSVTLSNDGTNYIATVIRGDASSTVSLNIWNGTSWSGWVDQTTDASAKSALQSGPTSHSGQTAAAVWTEGSNPYSLVGAALSSAPPVPTRATLSGATSGYVGIAVTYTITLDNPAGVGGVSCPVASTPGWTVTSSPVVIAQGTTSNTFTVTPTTVATGSVSLSATTPSLTLAGTPISLTATVHPSTTATLSGPTKGHPSVVSPAFTVTLDYPADQTYTITPASSGSGDTCSPATLTFSIGDSSHTFTVTPGSGTGSRNVTITSSPVLSYSGSPIAYVTAAGNAYTSTKSGNWNDYTVWGGGIPISGDTATIAAGHTVTVPDSYTATIGATGQATGYTALTIANGGALVIGGGSSGGLNLQGDVSIATQSSVATVLTVAAGATLRFKPSSGQRIKIDEVQQGMIVINGTSSHRCAVLTDATALSGGGLTGYLQGYASAYSSGLMTATYCDFTDLGDGSTNGAVTCSLLTGQSFTLTYNTFTRCEGMHASLTDSAASVTVTNNYWTSSVGTIYDNGLLVNLRLDNTTDKTGGTRLMDSNRFDLMLELLDGRDVTLSNNGFVSANSFTGHKVVISSPNDGKKWATFNNNLVYGSTDSNIAQVFSGGDISSCLFLMMNSTVYVYSIAGSGATNDVTEKCIFEYPASGPTEVYFYAMTPSVGSTVYQHTVRFNLLLPSHTSASAGAQLLQFNGYGTGMTGVAEHNTVYSGTGSLKPVQYDETTSHTQWLTYYRGNLLWNSVGVNADAYHFVDENFPTTGGVIDFCLAANADYNATYNCHRDMPGDGQAHSYGGSGTVHTIASCANNGSGLIRVVTNSAHGLTTGNTVYIEGCTVTTEANNGNLTKWTVTTINATTVDLQGSTFSHASTHDGRLCTTYPFAGNGYQSHFSGGFAGAHDVSDGNPLFLDSTRNVGTWYTAASGANQTTTGTYLGDVAAAAAYIAGNPATDPSGQIGTRISACMNWIRAGFRPRRAALSGVTNTLDTSQSYTVDAAGNALGGTVGAMAYLSTGSTGSVLGFLDQSHSGGFSDMGL
jgi:hypothetical protein